MPISSILTQVCTIQLLSHDHSSPKHIGVLSHLYLNYFEHNVDCTSRKACELVRVKMAYLSSLIPAVAPRYTGVSSCLSAGMLPLASSIHSTRD